MMQPDDQRQALAALAGDKKILQALPADSPLVRHLPYAEAALAAYCDGDSVALGEALKKIPFRSPYRDLRFLLQALACYPASPADGRALLARIGTDSAFAGPARVAGVLFSGDGNNLRPGARELVRAIRGRSDRVRPKQIFSTLLAAARKDPGNLRLKAALAALLVCYPAGRNAYRKVYGPLPRVEEERLQALTAERSGDLGEAVARWEAAGEAYESAGDRLRAAAVARHLADLMGKTEDFDTPDRQFYLEKALALDPGHRDSWLQLAELHRRRGDDRSRGRVLEQALAEFPDDPGVLEAAAEATIERGAFKKAARLTQKLLRLDPINRRAGSRLLTAHLRHARKQIKSGRYELAGKELRAARELAREPGERARVAVLAGCLAQLRGDESAAGAALQEAESQLPVPLADFLIAAETLHLQLPPQRRARQQKRLRQVLDHLALRMDKTAVSGLLDLAVRAVDEGADAGELLKPVRPFLRKGTGLDWGEAELTAVCERLLHLQQYQLIRDYARSVARWRQMPALAYFDVVARCRGEAADLSYADAGLLEQALERAKQTRQHRWVARIMDFLEAYEQSRLVPAPLPLPGGFPLEELERLSRETGIPLQELLPRLLEKIFHGKG